MSKDTGIYKLSFDDGTFYVGQSLDISNRYREHLNNLYNNTHFNYKVQAAYNKCGEPKLEYIISCKPSELNHYEVEYIDLSNKNQLNILPGGNMSARGELSPRAIYYDNDILEVFLILAEYPNADKQLLSYEYSIDINTIYDISAGRGRALNFKDSHTVEYNKIISNKAINTRGRNKVVLTNGEYIVELVTGQYSKFCRENGIQPANLSKLIKGERKTTMGWKLIKYE